MKMIENVKGVDAFLWCFVLSYFWYFSVSVCERACVLVQRVSNKPRFSSLSGTEFYWNIYTQQTHYAIMTSLLRQNDVILT